jgi:signal transduction histidine kinase
MDTYSSSFYERHSFQMEYRLRRADGEYRWLLDNGVPRFERGGAFVGYIGSCVDITDLKRAQEEHLAAQKLESVGTLASGIAHDFNNLLGGILAQSEMALVELASGSRPEEEMQKIRAVAIRGAEIVRQLLIYAGQESEVLELVDVSRIVEEMLELLKVSVSKHAAMETALGRDLPAVRANPAQLRQLVMNLIINASEAIGDRDGLIRLTTGRVTIGRDSFVGTSDRLAEGDYLQLEVSDTGCGMTTDMQARVFDPFFTTKPAGHGLGLAVVQGIVRSTGGTIRLVSEPGKGTTFQILLPCAEYTPQETHSTTAGVEEEDVRTQAPTVLVVEDEDLLRLATSRMLRKKCFTIIEASNGSAAMDLMRAHRDHIDVILLDVTLRGASSREVFKEAKRLRPNVKVIVTSAYNEDAANASLGARVERFIRKPYSLGEVIDTIREVLSS